MNRRHILLAVALMGTVIAAVFAPEPVENAVVVSSAKTRTAFVDTVQTRSVSMEKGNKPAVLLDIKRRLPEEDESTAFQQVFWMPPVVQKTVQVKEEPPAPQAPPLPFKVLGLYSEDEQESVFLQLNDQNLVVKEGDTINGTYKVTSYKGGVLDFLYLPLNQHQTLVVSRPE
jgi:hypothetical protein